MKHLLFFLSVLLLAVNVANAQSERQPWTTSRIKGTPEGPLPYQARRSFPQLTFREPVLLAHLPGTDRLIVGELPGRFYSFPERDDVKNKDVFFDMPAHIKPMFQVFGLAFHPKFEENRYCYICYVNREKNPEGTHLSRFRVSNTDPPRVLPETETVFLTWLSGGHNGGCLAFGPEGHLYVTTGDATEPTPADGLDTGQNLTDLLSVVMRIDVDHPEKGKEYSIPKDNPFVNYPGARPEIWAYGFRNPWRMSFDKAKGDLWLGDVGWEMWEMIYRIEKGGNYGWSYKEGPQIVRPDSKVGPTPILPPTVAHSHAEAASITGGYVYHGKRLADLQDVYVYGDYETGKVWGLRHDGKKVTWQQPLADTRLRIVSFGEGAQGELYFLSFRGAADGIFQFDPAPVVKAEHPFPRKLSETGLFQSTREHTPAAGVYPFQIQAEMWLDHAQSDRMIAIPERGTIRLTSNGERIPENTVLAKTIRIEMKQGDPASARRLETQVLHYNGSRWLGYSYLWNDEQTDAELVDSAGLDRKLTISDPDAPGGMRQQTWHVASRTQCNVCHSPSNQFRIALQLPQLDEKQRDFLAKLDLLKVERPARKEDASYVNPHDESTDLTKRARSYLQVNCAHCHQFGGGGTANFDIRFSLGQRETKTVGIKPVQGTFSIPDACLITPGDPYRSVLFYRMAKVGSGRMPHIGSTQVDRRGLDLIERWIRQISVDEPASLAQIINRKLPDAEVAKHLDIILANPSGALALMRALDQGKFAFVTRQQIFAKAAKHDDPQIRDLFERFIPEDQRVRRLGNNIDAKAILALSGDVSRGEKIFFERAGLVCSNCHKIDGKGKDVGPDLSTLTKTQSTADILDSIVNPSKKIDAKFASYAATLHDGRLVTGILLERNDKQITLIDARGEKLQFPARDIELLTPSSISLMPENLAANLTAAELADLLAFVARKR